MTQDLITLSIIIVSWNVKDLLKNCLDSIARTRHGLSLEVIVVDNASSDETRGFFDGNARYRWVHFIWNDENVGFGRGNNIGYGHAKGKYVLFLNDDTEVLDDALKRMVSYMDNHLLCGALGPKLLNTDGTVQRSVRSFPTLFSQVLVFAKLHNFVPWMPALRRYFLLDFDYTREQETDQVMGAALMVRQLLLRDLVTGESEVFDPGYRRIFEEVDLCYRIHLAGSQVRYFPGAEIIHHRGSSFSQVRIFQKQLDFNQGMLRFFKKYKPRWQYLVLSFFQSVSWVVTGLQVVLSKAGDPVRKRFKRADL